MLSQLKKIAEEERPSDFLRGALFVVILATLVLSESNIPIEDSIFSLIRYIALLVLFFIEITSRHVYTKQEIGYVVFLVFLAIQALYLSNGSVFTIAATLFLLRSQEVKKIAGLSLGTISSIIILVIIGSLCGLVPDTVIGSEFSSRGLRFSFGFEWPSRVQTYVLLIICLTLLIYRQRLKPAALLVLALISTVVFKFTNAQYPYLISLILCAIALFVPRFKKLNLNAIILKRIAVVLVAGIFLLPVVAIVFFNPENDIWHMFDVVLSDRLSLSSLALQTRDLSLLGDWKSAHQDDYYLEQIGFLDSGYLNLLFSFGVIVFVATMFIMIKAFLVAMERNDHYGFVVLSTFIVFTLFYSHMLLNLSYGVVLFLCMGIFSKELNKTEIAEVYE